MSGTMVESALEHSADNSPARSRPESTATFGLNGNHADTASVSGAGSEAGNARHSVPDLSVNGSSLPQAVPRPPKSSTPSVGEGENMWGANFWVTLVEPQVCRMKIPFRLGGTNFVWHTLLVPNPLLCVSRYRTSELGPASGTFRVSPCYRARGFGVRVLQNNCSQACPRLSKNHVRSGAVKRTDCT